MHRVYMSFQFRDGWQVQFLEEDLKTPLPRRLTFRDDAKLVEMVRRGGGFHNLEQHQQVDHGIAMGRGGVYLTLTEEQYRRLTR